MNYFAYGSNLLDAELLRDGVRAERIGKARLDGYQLQFTRCSRKRKGGVADIVRTGNQKDVVWGFVYDITEEGARRLDAKEGVPTHCERIEVSPVMGPDGTTETCLSYTVKNKESYHVPPTRDYLSGIVRGANEKALPPDYIAVLEKIKTAPPRDCAEAD
ncbi:MAG: gamma-glutamylcyclotransferase [Chloroflexi bacterium]|nr:gamma-glutamylcyclotransferase [Chloroflexota bacterium]